QCFLVNDEKLVAGDTLFLNGCGRTDLPGSNPAEMYRSLTQVLSKIPDDVILHPGHLYSEKPSATMAETRDRNVVFRPQSEGQWLARFGGSPPRAPAGPGPRGGNRRTRSQSEPGSEPGRASGSEPAPRAASGPSSASDPPPAS